MDNLPWKEFDCVILLLLFVVRWEVSANEIPLVKQQLISEEYTQSRP